MKGLKSLMIGASVAIFNIGTAFTQVFRPERCTGSCGSCGASCVNSLIGLVGIGLATIMFKKVKGKFNNIKASLKNKFTILKEF